MAKTFLLLIFFSVAPLNRHRMGQSLTVMHKTTLLTEYPPNVLLKRLPMKMNELKKKGHIHIWKSKSL